jgi:hypothetical protein
VTTDTCPRCHRQKAPITGPAPKPACYVEHPDWHTPDLRLAADYYCLLTAYYLEKARADAAEARLNDLLVVSKEGP